MKFTEDKEIKDTWVLLFGSTSMSLSLFEKFFTLIEDKIDEKLAQKK